MLSTAGDNVNVDIDSLILANPSNDDDAERLRRLASDSVSGSVPQLP